MCKSAAGCKRADGRDGTPCRPPDAHRSKSLRKFARVRLPSICAHSDNLSPYWRREAGGSLGGRHGVPSLPSIRRADEIFYQCEICGPASLRLTARRTGHRGDYELPFAYVQDAASARERAVGIAKVRSLKQENSRRRAAASQSIGGYGRCRQSPRSHRTFRQTRQSASPNAFEPGC